MLGENVDMSRKEFQPYLPDHKDGYYELKQIKPGVVLCPFCDNLIDATQNEHVKAAVDVLAVWPRSWASVPICRCPGVWAVYSPSEKKWAFRFKESDGGSKEWQK